MNLDAIEMLKMTIKMTVSFGNELDLMDLTDGKAAVEWKHLLRWKAPSTGHA